MVHCVIWQETLAWKMSEWPWGGFSKTSETLVCFHFSSFPSQFCFLGGDPRKVTLAGHGQGATIAHLLALNPTTSGHLDFLGSHPHFRNSPSGLFSKMILLSGSALCEGSLSSPTLSYSSSSSLNSPYSSSSYSSSSYSSSSTSTR